MAGQLTQVGAQYLSNTLGQTAVPYIGATAPSTWIPGQYWYDTTTSSLMCYDPTTSAWVTGPYVLYLALLTVDPATLGPSSTPVQTIAQMAAGEDTTAGYARQAFTMGTGTSAEPSVVSNTNTITFGPYTANQAAQVSWTALLAIPTADVSSASTTTSGLLMYTWTVPVPQQVLATKSIQIAPGTFQIGLT